jgi:hypothetical protein
LIRLFIILLLSILCASSTYSQDYNSVKDSLNKELTRDTFETEEIKIADSGLDTEILYGAIDSQKVDHKTSKVHLYGNAFVNYRDKALKADYIILDIEKNIAEAHYIPELKNASKPLFIDNGKEYNYNGLKYNFETEKGIVFDALFDESGFFIHGSRTKYVSAGSDQYNINDEVIYNQGATITTCNHDHPHFGFQARRMKVIKDKVAVLGPSNLKLGGVSTPLILPFGVLPLVEGKSSGFIFPQNYEFNSANLGFGLRGFGWYFPVSDYLHFTLTADAYTRGSFALYANSNYRKNYKYSGSLNLSYSNRRFENASLAAETILNQSQQGYTISLRHNQDAKAHPYITVGGSINIVGNNNENRTSNNAFNVLTNTYRSSFSYNNSLPGTPFSLGVALNHNQNTNTGVVNLTLPDATLNMNTIYPFRRKNRGSNSEKWFDNISFDYDSRLSSFVEATDSTLFSNQTLRDIRTGITHTASTGFSTRVLKHFNIVPNASATSVQVINTIDRRIEAITDRIDTILVVDGLDTLVTTQEILKDTIIDENLNGFDTYTTYRAGVRMTTQLFGTVLFKKGWLRGIRQTIKPTLSYDFAPDTRSQFTDTLSFIANSDRTPLTFTRFDDGPFGNPRLTDLQSQVTFSVNNVVELKHWSKKDSTEKKFKIFDNVSANMTYNFAADSLQWSRLTINSTSRFFNGITQLSSNWTFDPYIEVNNVPVNRTVHSETGKLLRIERGTVRVSSNLDFRRLMNIFNFKKGNDSSERDQPVPEGLQQVQQQPQDRSEQESLSDALDRYNSGDSESSPPGFQKPKITFFSLIENISINHNLIYSITSRDGVVSSEITTNSLDFRGNIQLTDNWAIAIGNIGYEFTRGTITYPDIRFVRQLHCWNMNFGWTPNRDTYSFFIGVTSSNLSFLKYNYGRNNIDGFFNPLSR